MTRLHLIVGGSAAASPAALAAFADDPRHDPAVDHVVLLGRPETRRDAERIGLRATALPRRPAEPVALTARRLRRLLGIAHPAEQAVAYRDTTWRLAQRVARQATRRRAGNWFSDHVNGRTPALPTASRTRIDPAAVARKRDAWDASPKRPVVGLVADPAPWADTLAYGLVVGLANLQRGVGFPRLDARLLVHPEQRRRAACQRRDRAAGSETSLLQDADAAAPWRALPACDALVLTSQPGHAAAWAAASGRPIVAPPGPVAEAIQAAGGDVRLARSNAAHHLADTLQRVLRDRAPANAPGVV